MNSDISEFSETSEIGSFHCMKNDEISNVENDTYSSSSCSLSSYDIDFEMIRRSPKVIDSFCPTIPEDSESQSSSDDKLVELEEQKYVLSEEQIKEKNVIMDIMTKEMSLMAVPEVEQGKLLDQPNKEIKELEKLLKPKWKQLAVVYILFAILLLILCSILFAVLLTFFK